MTDATWKELPRLILSALIIAFFGYALVIHWTLGLEETLKNITMLAVGYWLGSSKGSSDRAATIDKQLNPPAPQSAEEAADQTAGAAVEEAAQIKGQAA